ncbi:MAG: RHS repeat protein, partial [Chloroflexi bacterium]|nr:RHS repeat protein [Chloroflexota bacterium]
MRVERSSKGDLALGMRQPVEAAGVMASASVILDLLTGDPDVVQWLAAVLAAKWAADGVLDNTLTVRLGTEVLEFTRLPDGSYSPPPGMVLRLTEVAGGYLLENAAGARYEFDAAGQMVRWQDANENALTLTYGGSGLLQSVSNGLGITLTFAYSGTQLCQVTDMAGRSVHYGYVDGNLVSYTDAAGNTWRYEYDEDNRLTAMYSPNTPGSAIVTNVYNDLSQVATQTNGLGNVTSFAFSSFRSTEENPDGSRVIHYFDHKGSYVGREDSVGNRTEMAYDGLQRLRQVTDRLGDSTSFAYDLQSGRLAAYCDAEGNTTALTYTPRPDGAGLTAYDLTCITYADGSQENWAYDTHGNPLACTDRLGHTWSYTFNARGQPLTITNPSGGVITYTYTANGQLASYVNSDVGTTHLSYDAYLRPTNIIRPDGSAVALGYDLNDRFLAITDERGQTIHFAYDANGNLLTTTDPLSQTHTFAYDLLDRRSSQTDPVGQVVTWSYDALGRLAALTDCNGYTTTYGYNSRGWLSQFTDAAGQSWGIARDAEAVADGLQSPLGLTTAIQTDRMGRTTAVTDALGAAAHLAY